MTATKTKAQIENRFPFQPVPSLSPVEQLQAALRRANPEVTVLESDETGAVIIDPDKHPHLYDWMMNG